MSEIDKSLHKKIGERFKKFRLSIGQTQAKMAEIMGITQTTVTCIEKGKSMPSVHTILKLHEVYNLSLTWLLTGKGKMRDEPLSFDDDVWGEYKEEIKEIFNHIKDVPMVRDFMMEKFYLFKLQHKKEILDYLESKNSPEQGNGNGD